MWGWPYWFYLVCNVLEIVQKPRPPLNSLSTSDNLLDKLFLTIPGTMFLLQKEGPEICLWM